MPTAPHTSDQVAEILQELYERHLPEDRSRVESYYQSGRGYYPPADAGDERGYFAISLVTVDGEAHEVGDRDVTFPMQSMSKVFAYALALADHSREDVLTCVGVEPSGETFNSLAFDVRNRRPHNPMVNSGALVTSDLVRGATAERKAERVVDVMRTCAGSQDLAVDRVTLSRELRTADRNRATAYLLRSEGMLGGDVDVDGVLETYLRQCSVHVTCTQLATMAATLANGCRNPITRVQALPRRHVRDLLSVMYTCGMYDAAGTWAYDVGVPAKSSVSGAILAVVPGKMGIGVYSPGLDAHGNSVRGVDVCRELAAAFGLHVFATEEEDAILGPAEPAPEQIVEA